MQPAFQRSLSRAKGVAGLATAFALLLVLPACSGSSAAPRPASQAASATPAAAAIQSTPGAASVAPGAHGTPSAPAATPAATGTAAAQAGQKRQAQLASLHLTADLVVRGFQREELPIGKVEQITATNDPDHQLGVPGQYTSREAFQDTTLTPQGDPFDITNGGAVEVFASAHDAQVAKDALAAAADGRPTGEVDTVHGPVLLRLSTRLQPDQQSAYELGVNDVLRVLLKRQAAGGAQATPAPQAASRPRRTPGPAATPSAGQKPRQTTT